MPKPKVARYNSMQDRLKRNSKSVKCKKLKGCGNCRIWTGYTVNGYGRTNIRTDRVNKSHFVHRISKVLSEILSINPDFDIYDPLQKVYFIDLYAAYGKVKLTIDHICGDSLCINPNHLEWVWLDKNQQRKKWLDRKRSDKIILITAKDTRHERAVSSKSDLSSLTRMIKSKKYRRKY
jgi:hypothetical protein